MVNEWNDIVRVLAKEEASIKSLVKGVKGADSSTK